MEALEQEELWVGDADGPVACEDHLTDDLPSLHCGDQVLDGQEPDQGDGLEVRQP